jgi:general secretion pathway protein G
MPLCVREAATLRSQRGYTFIELLVVTTILLILASAVLPLAQVASQRQREAELRRALRELRTAIDAFKDAVDLGRIPTTELEPGNEGYPPDLDTLVEGIAAANDASGRKLRFLRRIPVDPMTGETEWGLRSYQDSPTSTTWGRQNVFDVYSISQGTALDGTEYRTW